MSFLTWIRLTAHRVVNDGDLGKVIAYTPKVIELCRVTYVRDWMRMCVEFRDEILLRGEECETPRITIFTYPIIYTIVQKNLITILLYKTFFLQK